MRRLLFCLLVSFAAPAAFAAEGAPADHPALALLDRYHTVNRKAKVGVSPYIINVLAMAQMKIKGDVSLVLPYMEWYVSRLAYPDRYGLTGTIYDIEISPDGTERKLLTYDSADSYSATFLMVVREYVRLTGDKAFPLKYAAKLKDVAYNMAYLQDSDGLTWAKPLRQAKYLMDNCEVYGGLNAYIELAQICGWDSAYYEVVRKGLLIGLEKSLYDADKGVFHWAIDRLKKYPSDWTRFYPDGLAQMFPALYELPFLTVEARKALWNRFLKEHGERIKGASYEQRAIYMMTRAKMESE